MLLIRENVEEVKYLKEEKEDGSKSYFIEGTIMQGDVKNRNGRIYPSNVLVREMSRYNENYVATKRAYGELGHPNGPTINLDRVSHMFTELKQEGANIIGKAKIMETPMGKIVKNLIDEGAQLGISSRGMGTLKENKNGVMEVQEDFMLATAGDIVADPSGPDCFVRGIMEGKEWIYDVASNSWTPYVAQRIVEETKAVARVDVKKLEEQKFRMFQAFLNTL